MRRREFLVTASAAALITSTKVVSTSSVSLLVESELSDANKLSPPDGPIPVAFAMSRGATMIDFAGPWEVFPDVMIRNPKGQGSPRHPFSLYTVSEKTDPIEASGGMKIIPDHTFETSPTPKGSGDSSAGWLTSFARVATQNRRLDRRHDVCVHRRVSTWPSRISVGERGHYSSRLFRSVC